MALIDCQQCRGTGKRECECDGWQLRTVENHPLNSEDFRGHGSSQGYVVKVCKDCGSVWGIRYQYDDGTGSDNRYHNFGQGDPLVVATTRHY